MRNHFLVILILTLLFSCGQKDSSGNVPAESTTISKIKNASYVENEGQINHNIHCRFDNQMSGLGEGLVIVPSKFEIYNDSLLTIKHANWDMYEDESKIDVCPKFFKPDYGIMHFVYIGQTEKAYKVLVNYSDIKYLPKTKDYEFETWENYILQSYGIRRKTTENGDIEENLPLRTKPNENAETLKIPSGFEMFCPIELKGDWVKVKYDCFYNVEDNPHDGEPCYEFIQECNNTLTGWLRWRQENKLLIDIFMMP